MRIIADSNACTAPAPTAAAAQPTLTVVPNIPLLRAANDPQAQSVEFIAREYIAAGFALVPLPSGSKGPNTARWNQRPNAWTRPEHVPAGYTGNLGLAHAYSTPLTFALDVDDYTTARKALAARGVNLDALLADDDAVQVRSRENRAKLIYRLGDDAEPLNSINRQDLGFELRCAASGGVTVQDVLPPSIHPDTGQAYAWGGAGDWRNLPEIPDELLMLYGALQSEQVPASPLGRVLPETGLVVTGPVCIAPENVLELRSALKRLCADDRQLWISVGHDLYELGDVGRELWTSWSQTSAAWKPSDAQTWDTFKGSRSGYASVFKRAQAAGWVNPRSGAASLMPASAGAATSAAPTATTVMPPRRAFELVHARELLAAPTPLAWAISGLFTLDSLVAIIGQPSSAKTFFAIDLAACIATGIVWHGHTTAQGAVIYLAGEGVRTIARRLAAWEISHGQSLREAPLYVSRCAALLDQAPEVDAVIDAIENIVAASAIVPRMIVVDTLARSFSGNSENDATDMARFVRGLDALREKYGAAVVVVHHAGLAEGAEMRARGSSAFLGALDTCLVLTNKDDVRTLHMTKAKDFEAMTPQRFKLEQVELPGAWADEDGVATTSAVLVPLDGEDTVTASAVTERQQLVLDVVLQLAAGGTRALRSAVSRELKASGKITDRKAVSKTIGQLLKRGSLLPEGDYLSHAAAVAAAFEVSYPDPETLH